MDDGEGEGESLIGQARPSPWKETAKSDQSRSLVGYTPSQSVEYDVVSLNPPIRTSTPVYAQEQGYGRSTSPLPPYSVSDISQSLDGSENRYDDGLRTPRATQSPWSQNNEDVIDAVVREMERRADEFYKTGMMGRCWDVWRRASDWIQVTTEHSTPVDSPRKPHTRLTLFETGSCFNKRLSNGERCINGSWICQTRRMPIELIIYKPKFFKRG